MRNLTMLALRLNLLATLRSALRTRAELALQNLALCQQLANLGRSSPRPPRHPTDLGFWIALAHVWSPWTDALVILKPDTVVRWHRAGFRLFWEWKSRSRTSAKDHVSPQVTQLIRRMAEANATWDAPRIHGELLKLGIVISERSRSRFMPRKPRQPPSQTWRTFLDNHLGSLASIDIFTLPTATFRIPFVFFVLLHDRRRGLHFNITDHPGPSWTAHQIVEPFAEDTWPSRMPRARHRPRPAPPLRTPRSLKSASLAARTHGGVWHESVKMPLSPTAARRSRPQSETAPPREQRRDPLSAPVRMPDRAG